MSTPGRPGKSGSWWQKATRPGRSAPHLLEHELDRGTLEGLAVDVGPATEGEQGDVGAQPVEDAAPVARAAADQHRTGGGHEQVGQLPAVMA